MSFFENVKTAQDLADEEQQIFNQQEHDWVKSELKNVDLQISLHLTDDRRATSTLSRGSGTLGICATIRQKVMMAL
ncbi:hypothetical protein PCI56_12610 [Plesiomonas shigelloides subsp. oncorhynchi]|nr:hypothetical protein [Plesiomonas shigelloides]